MTCVILKLKFAGNVLFRKRLIKSTQIDYPIIKVTSSAFSRTKTCTTRSRYSRTSPFSLRSIDMTVTLTMPMDLDWSNAKHAFSKLSIGGSRGACRAHAPHGTQFFHFCIHFRQKAPVSEVHTPQRAHAPPPTGNPGFATAFDCI